MAPPTVQVVATAAGGAAVGGAGASSLSHRQPVSSNGNATARMRRRGSRDVMEFLLSRLVEARDSIAGP